MKILHSFAETEINEEGIDTQHVDTQANKKSAVTVGKFDGVHVGHDFLIEKMVAMKREGYEAVVVTFDRPPKQTIGETTEKTLMSKNEKYALLDQIGVDNLLELFFDEEMMRMTAEDFIRRLVESFHMEYMVAGRDFTFGYKGAGDVELLEKLAEKYGFRLEIVEKLKSQSRDISSTYIREEIAAGHIKKANELLGYPYFIIGEIVHGNHIGSTKIGRATINISPPDDKLLPPNGVYISEVHLLGRKFHGITNVGIRPSIREKIKKINIETHILDFDENVYDDTAKVVFLAYLRPEKAFDSIAELKQQIEKDVRCAYAFFNEKER